MSDFENIDTLLDFLRKEADHARPISPAITQNELRVLLAYIDSLKAHPPCGAGGAVPAGYRLQPLSEYEAMRHALDMPDGDFPKWKELVIADLQTSYDSDGITHEDSGDPLIYLQSAIAIVEDMLLPDALLASQPAAPVAQVAQAEGSQDAECICHGNWRRIIKDSEPLFGVDLVDREGTLCRLVGVLHADDDYYYAVKRSGVDVVRFLSCVGSLEDFGIIAAAQGDATGGNHGPG